MQSAPYATRRTILVLAAALAITGCDSRDLTAPAPRSPQSRAAELSSPLALGSATVTPPGTSGARDVLSPPRATIASVPESAWVVITASGQLSLRRNPDCDLITGFWTCPAKIVTPDFEAAPSPVGPLHLWVQTGSTSSTVNLRGSGGAGETPGSAIGLLHQTTAGTLEGEMSVWQAETFNPNGGGGIPSWFLGGGYHVSAKAVPSPVALSESEPDSTGARTYTVAPLYGLVFMNPAGDARPAGAINWYFIPGDSVSSTPGWSEPNEWIQECQFQFTCRFQPPGPGKVQVSVSVERQGVTVRSSGEAPRCEAEVGSSDVRDRGCAQEPKLMLICNDRQDNVEVVRAATVHCRPKSDPEGSAITIVGWEFAGTGDYRYPTADDEPVTDPEWFGPMVMSGKIAVRARVGTSRTDQVATINVTVAPRTQVPAQPDLLSVRRGTADEFKDPRHRPQIPPVQDEDLGRTEFSFVVFGTSDPSLASTFIGFVTDGPNTHLAYLTRVPARVEAVVALNPEMEINSPFYKKQAHLGQVVTQTCVQENWARYIELILKHEGYPVNPESHTGYYEKSVRDHAWPAVEDVVSADDQLGRMVEEYRARLAPVQAQAVRASDQVDRDHAVHFGCEFRY